MNKQLFLQELTELSQKYGFYIEGCGCCGSPSLSATPSKQHMGQDLFWRNERYVDTADDEIW